MFEKTGEMPNVHFELWLWDLQRVGLSVEYPIIQADQVRGRKDQVEVFERLREPETLFEKRKSVDKITIRTLKGKGHLPPSSLFGLGYR